MISSDPSRSRREDQKKISFITADDSFVTLYAFWIKKCRDNVPKVNG